MNTTGEPRDSSGQIIRDMQAKTMPEIYILKMSMGITCKASMNGDRFTCHWTPPPPYRRKACKQIAREYEPWRNRIIADYAKKTGKHVMVITL